MATFYGFPRYTRICEAKAGWPSAFSQRSLLFHKIRLARKSIGSLGVFYSGPRKKKKADGLNSDGHTIEPEVSKNKAEWYKRRKDPFKALDLFVAGVSVADSTSVCTTRSALHGIIQMQRIRALEPVIHKGYPVQVWGMTFSRRDPSLGSHTSGAPLPKRADRVEKARIEKQINILTFYKQHKHRRHRSSSLRVISRANFNSAMLHAPNSIQGWVPATLNITAQC